MYAKAPQDRFPLLSSSKIQGVSLDQEVNLSEARKSFPYPFVIQGNLDPALMESDPEIVERETIKLLNEMKGDPGHILNLGHGIRPKGKIECVRAMTEATRNFPAEKT